MQQPDVTLYYFHDPMCSWCWGFKKTFKKLCAQLGNNIEVKKILGGLAADSDEPMAEDMRNQVQTNWSRIEATIPGVKFNFDFWENCEPRRSTYMACRAVIAARQQGDQYDELMTGAIQYAYYQQARNPSEQQTLTELARELMLDETKFKNDLISEKINYILQKEISFTREMFVESFPSLVLSTNNHSQVIDIDYNNYQVILNQIEEIMNAIY